ncbi:MAG: maleylpyruvate isomerase N-terminal domain-containing protein [Actinomycetota bacterium]
MIPSFDEAAASLLGRADGVAMTMRRNADRGDAWVSVLSWSLAELAAHVVSVPAIYRRVIDDPGSFVVPESMAAFGQRELEAVGTYDLAELADLLIANVEALVTSLAAAPERVPFYTTTMTRAGVLGVALNELSMHHRDMALVVDEPFEMSARDVDITMHGMMPASEVFCDHEVALRSTGTYHLGLRGGSDWTIGVADGLVSVRAGRPDRADVRIVGDPLAMVLMSFGRQNPVMSVVTGKVMVTGRRPWKLWWLRSLFIEELSRNGRGA